MTTKARLELVPKLVSIFQDKKDETVRYRCAWGGRGSGKTRSFAKALSARVLAFALAGVTGIALCGREFMNSLDESSMAEVKAAIRSEPELLEPYFDIGEKYIRTKPFLSGRVDFKFAGLTRNIDSIKSKSQILILWVDEAEAVSEKAWRKIAPTVRAEGKTEALSDNEEYYTYHSEIWVSWNPERRNSATNKRFRLKPPSNWKGVEVNWTDNPWFPESLNIERLNDKNDRPEQYPHVWGGQYLTVMDGAYYSKQILKAREQGRFKPNIEYKLTNKLYSLHDIGGAGKKSDAYTIWVFQLIDGQIRWLNYYEAQGQSVEYHIRWMRKQGYEDCYIFLPHDGEKQDARATSWRGHWETAGFDVECIPNQGTGAAMDRVVSTRLIFDHMHFDEPNCQAGIEAISFYHEKIDEEREVGLGPNHDWSSHAADAFGAIGVVYDDLVKVKKTYTGPKSRREARHAGRA